MIKSERNAFTSHCRISSKNGGFVFCLLMLFTLLQTTPVIEGEEFETIIYFTDTGTAEFTSNVPLHIFTGSSGHLTGMIELQKNIIDFYLDLNTLKKGIGRRDINRRLAIYGALFYSKPKL
ncbi:hypothetical protein BH23BAC3_BH23BAC3_14350 [soil metagenome]